MAHAAAATAAAAAASPGEGGNGGDEDEKAAAATALQAAMPEGVLPYVIHLLAHHPDYSSAKVSTQNDPGGGGVCVRVAARSRMRFALTA